MKLKLLLITVALGAGVAQGFGQSPKSNPSPREIVEAIDRSASSLQSMSCRFTQTKELSILQEKMVSNGVMYYCRQGGRLRWEYQSPYVYTFVMNGNRVMMRSDERTDVIDTSRNQLFGQIARIMMNTLTGRCLTAAEEFKTEVRVEANEWIAELTPRRRDMAQFFARIRLHFDPQRRVVSRVEMFEQSGDRTVIDLKNIRTDVELDEQLFAVD